MVFPTVSPLIIKNQSPNLGYSTLIKSIKSALIRYGNGLVNSITFIRSVSFEGGGTQPTAPTNLIALSGYNKAIPLAWKTPSGLMASHMNPNIELIPFHKDPNEKDHFEFNIKNQNIPIMVEAEEKFMKRTIEGRRSSPMAPTGYQVYRSTSSNGTYTKIADVSRPYYRDENVTNGQTYYYKVKAVYSNGVSDYSNTGNAKASTEYYISAGWASSAPTINGSIGSSEWSNAATKIITYPGESGTVELYVMNNGSKLFFAVDDQRNSSLGNIDGVGILFDLNKNREWPSSSGSNEGIIQLWWENGSMKARYQGLYGNWPDNVHGDASQTPGGISHILTANSGHVQWEGSFDLSSSPIKTSPGSTIGILIYSINNGSDFTGVWPQETVDKLPSLASGNAWAHGPFAFGDLKLKSSGSSAPGNLTATAVSSSQINLTWQDNSNNEFGFKIQRKTGSSGSWSTIYTTSANETSYQNTGLSANTTYSYRVYAYNSTGNSGYSNEANATTQPAGTAPSAPGNLTASAVSTSQINLTWQDNSNNESGFKIQSKEGAASWSTIYTTSANATSYQNTGLSANTTYSYRVYAYNSYGNSNYSNTATATTLGTNNPPILPVASSSQPVGSEFWVDIVVGDNSNPVTDLKIVSFELNYTNTSIVDFVSYEVGSFITAAQTNVIPDDPNGKISASVYRITGGNSGNGVVLRLKFKISNSATQGQTICFNIGAVQANSSSGGAITLTPAAPACTEISSGIAVWPGDANNDGLASIFDINSIVAIHWNKTGTARPNASIQWTSQPCPPWNPEAATYADCNGDGIVNIFDINVVIINFGKTHGLLAGFNSTDEEPSKKQSILPKYSQCLSTDAPIYIETRDYDTSSEEFWVDILIGSASQPVTDLRVVSFELTYTNTAIIDYVSYQPGSFMSGAQATVIADDTNGKISASVYQTSGSSSGNGVLLSLKFKAGIGHQVNFDFAGVMANSSDGSTIALNSTGTSIVTGPETSEKWVEQNSGVSFKLNSVKTVSKTVAWATGADASYGYILRTTDGGENWINVWNGPNTIKILHVDALDHNNALVTGYTGGDNIASIFKTTNGGSSWTKVYELAGAWVNHVEMFDSQNGIALGDPYNGSWLIIKTTDGGNSWQPISNSPMATEGAWSSNLCVFWLDNLKGFFGTNTPNFYYTVDGGLNWTAASVNFLQRTYAVAFNQSNYGVAYDNEGPLARTENAGLSWDEISPPGVGYIRHITYSENAFWITQGTSIYKSIDNGSTWELQASAESNLRFISFVTNQAGTFGWIVGDDGVIMKYSNPATEISTNVMEIIPTAYQLQQNYPNPFNPETTIRFSLPKDNQVELTIYNVLGQKIRNLIYQSYPAGEHVVKWDGQDDSGNIVNSGIYIYKIKAGDFTYMRKMTFMK